MGEVQPPLPPSAHAAPGDPTPGVLRGPAAAPRDPYAKPGVVVCGELGTSPDVGLPSDEVAARRVVFGANELPVAAAPGFVRRVARQLGDGIMLLLIGATAVSALVGERTDALIILTIVVVNAVLGAIQEGRAEAAAQALRDLASPTAVVVRDGCSSVVQARDIVPGDVVLLGPGDRVPADLRLLAAASVEVDSSLLTGESVAAEKRSEPPVAADEPVADHASMLHAGTILVRGDARGIVTATGTATQLGRIAALTEGQSRPAPLQVRLNHLSTQLLWLAIGVCVVLAGVAWMQGDSLGHAALVGVSLAVASVPEGLASVVTLTLALGMQRLARRGAIVRRLRAVEALGSVTVICTDKTGTLTRNEMRVARVVPTAGTSEGELLRAAVLAVDAHPTLEDEALREHARDAGVLPFAWPEVVDVLPFDTQQRMVAALVTDPNGDLRCYAKGAPEAFARRLAPRVADGVLFDAARHADAGLRVLAVLAWTGGLQPADDGVELLGLVAFEDPIREDASAAVATARGAGIRTIMLTGDHARTASAVARSCGLMDAAVDPAVVTGVELAGLDDAELRSVVAEAKVVARISPEQKLQVVRALQASGDVVAVTGDGVNDAPALSAADIGVAMGRGGTDAAREAADVVLTDNSFTTIVAAIEGGRVIRRNIVHFLQFLLGANLGEVLTFAAAILLGLGAPVTVAQILLVNLLTDGLPALALGVDPPDGDMLDRPPIAQDDLLAGRFAGIATGGLLTGAACFASFLVGRHSGHEVAQTMTFATLTLSQLLYVLAIRTDGAALAAPRNRWLTASLLASAAILSTILAVAPARQLAGAVPLSAVQLVLAMLLAAVPFAAIEALKAVRRR